MMHPMKQTKGFTILEVIILVAVLAVVGVITLPKFRLMLYRSREARTKTNLAELRGALAIYYSDNQGLYPSDQGTPETRLKDIFVPRYVKAIPPTTLTHLYGSEKTTIESRLDDQGDWVYSIVDGFIGVNSLKTDTKGKPISGW